MLERTALGGWCAEVMTALSFGIPGRWGFFLFLASICLRSETPVWPFKPIIRQCSPSLPLLTRLATARPDHASRRFRAAPRLEDLENRIALSSINLAVTSLADSGPGTLRSAIIQADSGSAGNTYDIRFKVRGTIVLESALPDLSESMSLIGPAARRLTVERDPRSTSNFGIFVVDAGGNVGISGMTIANGLTSASGSGGGINNHGTLVVSGATITGNQASDGGGIYNDGTATVRHSIIFRNQPNLVLSGGGIYNSGSLTVSDTRISSNQVFFRGGGIYNSGTLSVSDSRISSDSAVSNGGGIYNSAKLTVMHTNISGCGANSNGGGICNDTGGLVKLSDCTVSGDQAFSLFLYPAGYPSGGGIYNNGTFTDSHDTIRRNAAYVGGGVYNNGTLTESRDTISRNLAATPGLDGFPPLVSVATPLAGLSEIDSGGAIYNTGMLTQSQVKITTNTATSTGGGIDNTGKLTVSHATISGNTAKTGGGLQNGGSGQAELDDSTLNDASGGGIVNSGVNVHVKHTIVDGVYYVDKIFS